MMIKPKRFPKIRFYNLYKIGYTSYWHDWKNIKFNLTPRFEKYWNDQIWKVSIAGVGIDFDFRRGDAVDQINADYIVKSLPKN